jgi:hypothetical protein
MAPAWTSLTEAMEPDPISAIFQRYPVGQKRQGHRFFVGARTIHLRCAPYSWLVPEYGCPGDVHKDKDGGRHMNGNLAMR